MMSEVAAGRDVQLCPVGDRHLHADGASSPSSRFQQPLKVSNSRAQFADGETGLHAARKAEINLSSRNDGVAPNEITQKGLADDAVEIKPHTIRPARACRSSF